VILVGPAGLNGQPAQLEMRSGTECSGGSSGAFYNIPHFSSHLYYLPHDHHLSLSLTYGGHVVNNRESSKSAIYYKIFRL
jgi:hypothetical protein